MTIKERPKASELFSKGKTGGLVFGKPCSFDEAFPMIEDLTVKVTQTGQGTYGDDVIRLTKANFGEFVDCHNPLCYGGGFRVGQVIRQMVEEKKTEHKKRGCCSGWESSPGGRRRYRTCINRFYVEVRIKYKSTPSGP